MSGGREGGEEDRGRPGIERGAILPGPLGAACPQGVAVTPAMPAPIPRPYERVLQDGRMSCRVHGHAPYMAVAVHGGPGAPGSASSLARQLSRFVGTLEPFQTRSTFTGQVEELAEQIRSRTQEAVFVLGHSWGAWLSFALASMHPEMIRKVFLIGSGSFDAAFIDRMEARRQAHMSAGERAEYLSIKQQLSNPGGGDRDALLGRLGVLAGKADDFCVEQTAENQEAVVRVDGNQYEAVWSEGAELRKSGYFKKIADRIRVPVRIIHGAEDPTPIEGVVEPIRGKVNDLRWYLLERCGHTPWKERYAKEEFWSIIESEIRSAPGC